MKLLPHPFSSPSHIYVRALQPIELVKIRLQIQQGTAQSNTSLGRTFYTGPIDCLVKSIRAEGIRVLYKGHQSTFIREVMGSGSWFGVYETYINFMTPEGVKRSDLSPLIISTGGALAGMGYYIVPFPIDTIKSAIQATSSSSPPYSGGGATAAGGGGGSVSIPAIAKRIYRNRGIAGFYPGMRTTMIRCIPCNATYSFVYEQAVKWFKSME